MSLLFPATGHACDAAQRASLSALLSCLLRETDLIDASHAELRLCMGARTLCFALRRPTDCGAAEIDACAMRDCGGLPTRIDPAVALDLLLNHLSRHWPGRGDRLAARVRASDARIRTLLRARQRQPPPSPDFLTAEQALVFGHWMHPCPKALFGMSLPEERAMTPDWRGALRLVALSVRDDLIEGTDRDITASLPGFGVDPGPGRRLLPAHPLSWDRLRRTPAVAALVASGAIRDLGPVGPGWWATSSVRTLWRHDAPWQIKTSLPVTITNSQRSNKRHEMLAGALMARHLQTLPDFGPMRLIGDPHWLTLRLPHTCESGFELIFRENPWTGPRGGKVMQVAGLCAAPLPGQTSLLRQVMAGLDAEAWFRAYLGCALAPLIRLYDATGIGFEAHQQNALLDLSAGLPIRCDYRDNQGFYVDHARSDAAQRAIAQLTYPRAEVEDALGYTLIVNQVFGMIHRMASDAILPEHRALAMLAAHLGNLADSLPGPGAALARRWLSAPDLPAKGNLLTQLGGVDELLIPGERAPQVRVPNPLAAQVAVAHTRLFDVA